MPLTYRAGQWELDGAPLTDEALTAERDALADAWAEQLGQLAIVELGLGGPRAAIEFPLGRIERFGTRFLARIADMIASSYAAARGGVGRVTDAGWRAVVDQVARQEQYAQGFLADLRAGTVSEAQAVARARSYSGAAIEAWERGRGDQMGLQLPGFPSDGNTPCLGACRCVWTIEEFPDRWEATWQTRGDSGVCKGCQQRAKDWAPYVQKRTPEA